MTCTPSLRRPVGAAGAAEVVRPAQDERPTATDHPLVEWLRQDEVLPQFARFVLVGGGSSLVYALLFWTFHGLGAQPANVVAVVLSTVLANDLHRRLTFHAEERLGWTAAQVRGGGVSLIGLAATTVALGWLEQVRADAHLFLQLALVGAVFATIGCVRFVVLRWLFLVRRTQRA